MLLPAIARVVRAVFETPSPRERVEPTPTPRPHPIRSARPRRLPSLEAELVGGAMCA